MRTIKRTFLVFVIGLVCACSSQYGEIHLNEIEIKCPQPVYRASPDYLIYPMHIPSFHPVAALFPFRIKQDITPREYMQREMTRVLYASWLKHRVFVKLLLFSSSPKSMRKAAEIASKAGCDVMIMPQITYCLLGGESGDSIIAMKIDIYSCSDLKLIWSITHMGKIEHALNEDYVFFRINKRIPFAAGAVIIDRLATDIYPPIKRWAWQIYPIFPPRKKTLF